MFSETMGKTSLVLHQNLCSVDLDKFLVFLLCFCLPLQSDVQQAGFVSPDASHDAAVPHEQNGKRLRSAAIPETRRQRCVTVKLVVPP